MKRTDGADEEEEAAIAASVEEALVQREIEGVASWGGARALALAAAWRSALAASGTWTGGIGAELLSQDPQVLAWQHEAATLAGGRCRMRWSSESRR